MFIYIHILCLNLIINCNKILSCLIEIFCFYITSINLCINSCCSFSKYMYMCWYDSNSFLIFIFLKLSVFVYNISPNAVRILRVVTICTWIIRTCLRISLLINVWPLRMQRILNAHRAQRDRYNINRNWKWVSKSCLDKRILSIDFVGKQNRSTEWPCDKWK